ncbi:hypothetical protein M0R45_003054 [Rubus argutus]|uniref:Uncharacterized protein n=1 Tax=Rubus argutus TaxID=59490 RepID=A0AAW1YI44_RUBAR
MDLRIVEPDPTSPTASLKKKLRSSLCIIPCFTNPKSHNHHHHHHHNGAVTAPTTPQGYRGSRSSRDDFGLLRASSTSLSSPKQSSRFHHHHHYEFAELKDKCRSFIGRMGRHGGRRHSSDFKYDPLSYALNFDHEDDTIDDDSFPLRNFSARLPHSPPSDSAAASPASKEITACS